MAAGIVKDSDVAAIMVGQDCLGDKEVREVALAIVSVNGRSC